MIIEACGKAADAITVTILPAIVAAIADSFVRDRRNGGRPWHRDSWRDS
ncbi:hypothetical protein [Streptosporangium sp. NPDC006007]